MHEERTEILRNEVFDLYQQGLFEVVIEKILAAGRVADDDYDLQSRFGSSLSKLGRDEEAVEAFRGALALRPTTAQAFYNLGAQFVKMGHENQGRPMIVEANRLDSKHAGAASLLARIGADKDEMIEAHTEWERSAGAIDWSKPTPVGAPPISSSTLIKEQSISAPESTMQGSVAPPVVTVPPTTIISQTPPRQPVQPSTPPAAKPAPVTRQPSPSSEPFKLPKEPNSQMPLIILGVFIGLVLIVSMIALMLSGKKDETKETVELLWDALDRGDIVTVDQLTTVTSLGASDSKKMLIEWWLDARKSQQTNKLSCTIINSDVRGDKAVVTAKEEVHKGAGVSSETDVTYNLVKQNGKWIIDISKLDIKMPTVYD
ncbi:MAG: tetratricopeptide repeat protein [bacterium]